MDENRREEYRILGINIAYYRKLKGLSQLTLSEKAGISRTFLSNIEAPKIATSISLETLFNIADALDIPASKLLDFTPMKKE